MPLFALYVLRSLIIAESNETAMPQMPIGSPLDEFEFGDDLRLDPAALLHFGGSQSRAPTPGFLFRQIGEGTFTGFQAPEFLQKFGPKLWSETVSSPAGVHQLAIIVIAEYNRVERRPTDRVAADYELLPLFYTHFLPRTPTGCQARNDCRAASQPAPQGPAFSQIESGRANSPPESGNSEWARSFWEGCVSQEALAA